MYVEILNEVEYRPILGWPAYHVGSDGSVWSSWQIHGNQPATMTRINWRRLRSRKDKRGRAAVRLYRPGENITRCVHLIVLEAFVGPRPDGMEACHNNGDNTDNRASNLRWDTHRENILDKFRHGTMPLGEKHHAAKLTEEQVIEIRRRRAAGEPRGGLSKEFGIHVRTISWITCRRGWKHVSNERST